MIIKVGKNKKSFTVVCDCCKADLRDEGYGRIWNDEQTAFSNAEASSWSLEDGEYCYKCISKMPKLVAYKNFIKAKLDAIASFVKSKQNFDTSAIVFRYDGKSFEFDCFEAFEIYALENSIDVNKFEKFEIYPF